MYDFLIGPFSEFAFMRRALVGCLALTLGATPIGIFLILRRMSLSGDAMSHAILPGAALGYLVSGLSLGAMTIGGALAGFTVAILSGLVARTTAAREDSSLAAFYLISLASGVLLVSAKGNSIDLLHILFGSTLALNNAALFLIASISTITLLSLALLYRPLVMECLEPQFLRSISSISAISHYAFLILLVLNLVGGFHALGTLMAVGLMVLPAATAQFWSRELSLLLVIAISTAFLSSYLGLLISYHYGLAAGPAIILTAGMFYLFSLVFGINGAIRPLIKPHRHFQT